MKGKCETVESFYKVKSKRPIPPWTEVETAYIAGIIDGEGCIGIYGKGKNNRNIFIYIGLSNTNKNLMDWLSEMFGYRTIGHRPDARLNHKFKFNVEELTKSLSGFNHICE